MGYGSRCQGCCFMRKGGVTLYRCPEVVCPFNLAIFEQQVTNIDTCGA